MKDAVAEPGEFIGLHVGASQSNKQVGGSSIRTKDSQWWFFEVADVAELDRKPIRVFDEGGSALGPIDSGGSIDYTRLRDSAGDDILRNDDDDWQVYHFSLGIKQEKVRVYPRVPENQNGGGFEYLSGDEPDPTTPSDFGYKRYEEIGYENPSSNLDFFAWREGVFSEHQFGFYNDNTVAVDPLLKIQGASYDLRPVSSQSKMLQLLAEVGKPVDEQQTRVITVNWSPVTNRSFSYEVPDEWETSQNTITVQQANLPGDYQASVDDFGGGEE